MKIIVTGGSGFIGSNLVRLLIQEKDQSVINLDKLTYAGNAKSLADLNSNSNYTFEQIDLCDASALRAVFTKHQPDAVMHLAAESHVDRSIDGPGAFIQTNIVGTYNLLQAALKYWRSLPEAEDVRVESLSAALLERKTSNSNNMKKSNFRFLHVSTDEVYGSLTPDAPGFSETTPYDPHSPYSASKAASDHLARAWGDTYGLPVLVTNCSNNYGPYQFPEKLIPVVILKCLRGESIPVYGKGVNIRDWLYVNDHAEALYTVLTKGRIGETYNIGGNNELQNIELVRMICQLMDEFQPRVEGFESSVASSRQRDNLSELEQSLCGSSSNLIANKRYEDLITFVSDRPGHDMRYANNPTKIRDELGWQPKEGFDSGFRKTVKWFLENKDWWEQILSGDYKLERLGTS